MTVSDVAMHHNIMWIEDLLKTFMRSCSPNVNTFLSFHFDATDGWDSVKQMIDRIIITHVEGTRDAFLSMHPDLPLDAVEETVPVYICLWSHMLHLSLTIGLSESEIQKIDYDLPTAHNYQCHDEAKTKFTVSLQNVMVNQEQIGFEVEVKQ